MMPRVRSLLYVLAFMLGGWLGGSLLMASQDPDDRILERVPSAAPRPMLVRYVDSVGGHICYLSPVGSMWCGPLACRAGK
jgi:hypothetical protein